MHMSPFNEIKLVKLYNLLLRYPSELYIKFTISLFKQTSRWKQLIEGDQVLVWIWLNMRLME